MALIAAVAACGPKSTGNGDGDPVDASIDRDRDGGRPDALEIEFDGDARPADDCGRLDAIIRDFKDDHPDFEIDLGPDDENGPDVHTAGLVKDALGADDTPTYAPSGPVWPNTSGAANFHDWYHDRAGVNQAFKVTIELKDDGTGKSVYNNTAFFPIDDKGFKNQGRGHNFHFTTEIHTTFKYKGGETFTFNGDDDLWLFVNHKLAIDLGGLHAPEDGIVDLDLSAGKLGITKGETYPMDIFHAERHTDTSNFRVETNIACFTPD